jgi:hypothetical protein
MFASIAWETLKFRESVVTAKWDVLAGKGERDPSAAPTAEANDEPLVSHVFVDDQLRTGGQNGAQESIAWETLKFRESVVTAKWDVLAGKGERDSCKLLSDSVEERMIVKFSCAPFCPPVLSPPIHGT